MTREQLSSVVEDYLKTIYLLQREEGKGTTNGIARAMEVSAPTVTQTVRKLADLGLVEYRPYRGVILTDAGERIALEVIRHHRLVERFLHQTLGLSWARVHREADRWEHHLSDEVEESMAKSLNHPTHDPHGSPIPSRDLVLEEEDGLVTIGELEAGEGGTVQEVPDGDEEFLHELGRIGLVPGTPFQVLGKNRSTGGISVEVKGIPAILRAQGASRIKCRKQ